MESVDDHADVDRARVRRDPDSIAQGADRAKHHEFEADPEAILGRDGANASQALGMVDRRGRVRTELRPEAGHPRGAKLRCGLERSAYIILGRLVPEHQRLNIENCDPGRRAGRLDGTDQRAIAHDLDPERLEGAGSVAAGHRRGTRPGGSLGSAAAGQRRSCRDDTG